MSCKIISFANQKGGVGKSTIAMNFAVGLADRGYNTLLIDFDAQANLTKYCGVEPSNLQFTIGHAVADFITTGQVDYNNKFEIYTHNKHPNLSLIGANNNLHKLKPTLLQAGNENALVLKKVLDPLRSVFDYIAIDCAPSLDIDLVNALAASDEFIVVTTAGIFENDGVAQLMATASKVRKMYNQFLRPAGIICNMFDGRNRFMPEILTVMKEQWEESGITKIFNTCVPQSIRVKESQCERKPMKDYDGSNNVAKAIEKLVEEYIGR